MKQIPLSAVRQPPRGFALVDDEDFDRFGGLAWKLLKSKDTNYASRNTGTHSAGGALLLHRVICGLERGDKMVVDHINGNGLDNRRSNLRVVTHAVNGRNRRPRTFGSSRHRNVYWHKPTGRWTAACRIDGKQHYLGYFATEDEAAVVVEAFWLGVEPSALDAARLAA